MKEAPKFTDAFKQFIRLLILVKTYWGELTKGVLLGVVFVVVGMVLPYITKLLIDEVHPTQDVTLMHVLVGTMMAISTVNAVIGGIKGYFSLYTTSRIGNTISLLFLNHLQHLPCRFYDEHRVGEMTSRFQDVKTALIALSRVFETVFANGIYLIFVPPFLFLLQWKLALVVVIGVPLTVVVTAATGRALRRRWKHTVEAYADINAFQTEVLSHIRTFKVMALERFVYQKAKNKIDHAIKMQLHAGGFTQIVSVANGLLSALHTAVLTWVGWTLILEQEMTLGTYLAFTMYVGYLTNPLNQFVNLLTEFQQSAVSFDRMFEYLDYPVEQNPTKVYGSALTFEHTIAGEISIRDLNFGYSKENLVLANINLNLPKGKITAIVGASGAGKTSLLRLLTRMEEVDSGLISIDNIPITQIPVSDLRRQMSVVWQEVILLHATVWENLTLGTDSPKKENVETAVRICRLQDVIAHLPDGYNSKVAEWGASLSGGQRQRIAIARTIIRDTSIYIFDESTSNIDLKLEREILIDLFKYLAEKTIIFVTHRLTTASLAMQICVLKDGKITGVGTHRELLRNNECYRKMNAVNIEDSKTNLQLNVV